VGKEKEEEEEEDKKRHEKSRFEFLVDPVFFSLSLREKGGAGRPSRAPVRDRKNPLGRGEGGGALKAVLGARDGKKCTPPPFIGVGWLRAQVEKGEPCLALIIRRGRRAPGRGRPAGRPPCRLARWNAKTRREMTG